jgi:hypothetical protein
MSSPKDSSTPESVAAEADRVVSTERNKDYGHPSDAFQMLADLLNSLGFRRIHDPLKNPGGIKTEDCPVILRMLKETRLYSTPGHRDSLVDICGYAKVEEMIWDRINGGS